MKRDNKCRDCLVWRKDETIHTSDGEACGLCVNKNKIVKATHGCKGFLPKSLQGGYSTLCLQCASLYRPGQEWDSFHNGINRRCDACGKKALCAMMGN